MNAFVMFFPGVYKV